ncbi:restriction endonuclease subunit S [Hymenobacter nivis]|uniref:Restriction endonuclease subunit S n=1 Tax=Hymenobacter nivis TaxID=1850093 RepID=A0A502GWF8_9BACT|nr:restriction endonuclease subunit S [Hymenobacter nivis]TPG66747.1 restriction endonuclease subunit S [Hymenobacter nivis]
MSKQTEIQWGEVAIAETDEWQQYHLGDVADIQTGPFGSQLHSADYVAVGIPSIMPTNIGRRLEISKESIACITEADAQRLSRYLVEAGDIVYSRRGDVEKCAFITEQENGWLCGTGCLRIRFTSEIIHPKFCAYYLSTDEMKGWISSHAVGTTMPNLNSGILKRLPISLPSLSEQRAIVEVLSSLDDKIDLLHRQNATLEALAETLFRQWFVEEAKEEWEEGTLGDFFTLQRGFDLPIQNRVPGKFPILTSSGYSAGHNEFKIKGPGVTTGRSGVIGKVFFVMEDFWPLNTSLFIKEYKLGTPLFSYFTLKFADLEGFNAGSAVPTLNRNHVHAHISPIPPKDLINRFEEVAYPHFKKIYQNTNQIQTLSTLRDTLLPKLMSGEVRVAY